MKTTETMDVMHLLIAENAFAPANLKTLFWQGQLDENTVLSQRLKAIHAKFIKSDKDSLIDKKTLLPLFPGEHDTCTAKGKPKQLNAVDYARYLTKCGKAAPYGVQQVAEKLGHIITKSYNLEDQIKEDVLANAIQNSDLYVLGELDTYLKRIHEKQDFTKQTIQLIHCIEAELKYVKREVNGTVYRPNRLPQHEIERKKERAYRFSEYTRYSLQNLGEALAILTPVFIMAHADKDIDFERFMDEFDIVGIIAGYVQEARQKYGMYDNSQAIWKTMMSNSEPFYDPQEEPKNANIDCAIGAIRKDFPQIASILFDDFYAIAG
jgi:hypothetical protein